MASEQSGKPTEHLGVRVSSPDRLVWPDSGITKGDLVAYYEAVAERMLPHLANRALSLFRCPDGAAGTCFFQKHDKGGFPAQIKTATITENDGDVVATFHVEDAAGIVAALQMNTLEFHIWGSRLDEIETPDRIVFDLDPDEELGFDAVRAAALEIRDSLGGWALTSYPMLTGGKGIHIVAPLRPTTGWPYVKLFCRTFAEEFERRAPERFTTNIRKAKRDGRVFIDYLRNERGATAISPFSTRARPNAPCAVPVGWDELETLKAANGVSLPEAAERASGPDPWPHYFDLTQSVTLGMVEAVAGPLNQKTGDEGPATDGKPKKARRSPSPLEGEGGRAKRRPGEG